MKKIIIIILVLVFCSSYSGFSGETGHEESICLMENSSVKETIILDIVFHNGLIFPIESEQKTGCLLLHDYYLEDRNGDGIKDRYHRFAEFVDNNFDHCCINGY